MLTPWRSPHQIDPAVAKHELRALFGERKPVIVIDPARNPYPLLAARESGCETISLFTAAADSALHEVAPHLVVPSGRGPFVRTWASLWGENTGFLFASDAPLAKVRKHLRRFLMVGAPGGERVYFRFYDPRVLRAFLPACTPEEVQTFFGPIAEIACEDRDPLHLLRYRHDAGRLEIRREIARWIAPPMGEARA